ncbi:RNA methyltransferase tRNA(m5U54)methyltransferase [Microbotryomycetes sp. JL221]|nr:RNA methyltransferase tRNA(m5U54)methyltransferase [Microbotryomycetes sp. JL221]
MCVLNLDSFLAKTDSAVKAPPPGFIVHTESTTSILFASKATTSASSNDGNNKDVKGKGKDDGNSKSSDTAPVFLNPVQEYNRDLSVVAIRTWSEQRQKEKADYWEEGVRRKWARKRARQQQQQQQHQQQQQQQAAGANIQTDDKDDSTAKRRKLESGEAETTTTTTTNVETTTTTPSSDDKVLTPPKFKFTLLEALSATGLRAIRYAKEIPLLRYVVANDLSSSAVEDIRRNVEYNGLAPTGLPAPVTSVTREGEIDENQTKDKQDDVSDVTQPKQLSKAEQEDLVLGRVRVNEGDACVKMYNHRTEETRFDCIDLDPYGSAVPFLDAAVGAVADGGLLCITCTDMGVLAGHNYPEKAFTHYGGVCVNAEYSHEVGLRLVLNALAQTAARYGRHIEPLLSLSIDFYVRLFVKIDTGKIEVESSCSFDYSKTSLLYYCHTCQTPTLQPFGRVAERKNPKSNNINYSYHAPSGPPVGDNCAECGGKHNIAGPMWSGPLHNKQFVDEMLQFVKEHPDDFKTSPRLEGMLTVARNELEAPFYFKPSKLSGFFNSISPSLQTVGSALMNSGYSISRSHASSGSIKTDAPRSFVLDVFREHIKKNPVAEKNVKEGSLARRMLDRPQRHEINLDLHPKVNNFLLINPKLVMYQMNPQAHWGPARAAVKGISKKNKTTTTTTTTTKAEATRRTKTNDDSKLTFLESCDTCAKLDQILNKLE